MKTISYMFFFLLIITSTILSQGMPEVVWSIQGNSSSINAVSVSADGNKILSSDNHTVKTWDRLTHSLLNTYENQSTTLISSTISPDGNLFTAGYVVGIYPNPNLGESSVLDINTNDVKTVTFSPDGLLIASGAGGWDPSGESSIYLKGVTNATKKY